MSGDQFLDMYRQLEDLLDQRYAGKKRRYSSVIVEFLNSDESRPFRSMLDLCREIRNLLTHNAKIDGEDIVEPSSAVVQGLLEILEFVKKPPLAIDSATKGDNVFYAGINQTVIKIMGLMEKSGFSHVPILENGKFMGVFSPGTVFSYILSSCDKPITRKTTIGELSELLPIHMHGENYEFAPKDLTCDRARRKFQTVSGKNKRLSVIFITETGSQREPLLGMLTPLDVMSLSG